MRLGLDFDNTLISYDRLFHQIAVEQGLVPAETPAYKNAVRDHLRSIGREDDWTQMQGAVYGGRILEAIPFDGMLDSVSALKRHGVEMRIVSHKTRWPFLGERWDLHAAAKSWLERQGFFAPDGLGWSLEQVFFELTKEEKVARIVEQGCSHFVDDLPEILAMVPNDIQKILFAPHGAELVDSGYLVMRNWQELPALLKLS